MGDYICKLRPIKGFLNLVVILFLNCHRECQLVCTHNFSLTYGELRTLDPLADTDPDVEEIKKAPRFLVRPFGLAPPVGLEPTTSGLTVRRPI